MPALTHAPAPSGLRAAALIVALVAAACGGSTPTVAPTASPTIAPTPTPFDVSAAFLEIITDPDFSARMEIDGTMEMGVSATLSGTITGSGRDSRTVMSVDVAGTTQKSESITVDGTSYSRSGSGPWLADEPEPSSADTSSLNEWLRSLESVEDLGVVTKNGAALHHLSAGDEPLPPSALGLDSSTFTDPVVTIDFYTEDDGTPAVFAVEGTWVQLINGTNFNVEFVMDLTLTDVGSPVAIAAPDDVWTRYKSPLGYTMAHPADFSVENKDEFDVYLLDGEEWVTVTIWPEASGLSAVGFRDAILGVVAETWGAPVETPVAAVLGGEPGYLSTFNFKYDDGSDGVSFDVTAMHADQGWEVVLFSLPGEETTDFALLQQFLSTFAYAE